MTYILKNRHQSNTQHNRRYLEGRDNSQGIEKER